MKIVDYPEYYSIKCVRVDYPLWWVIAIAHKSSRILRIVGARIIITLAVWGLADFNGACIPSWRDIKIVKKIAGHVR